MLTPNDVLPSPTKLLDQVAWGQFSAAVLDVKLSGIPVTVPFATFGSRSKVQGPYPGTAYGMRAAQAA